jgi:hypothetical protein
MDARTLEALKASIAKWEKNTVAESPDEYRTFTTDCPLCNIFYLRDCAGCPVSKNTGKMACSGTPYSAATFAKFRWMNGDGDKREAQAAALEEVAFLKSLLPSDEAAK